MPFFLLKIFQVSGGHRPDFLGKISDLEMKKGLKFGYEEHQFHRTNKKSSKLFILLSKNFNVSIVCPFSRRLTVFS